MADMTGPWKCVNCKKMAKASAEYCAHCGKHWSKVWDNAPAEDNGTAWNYTRPGRSPRGRRQRQDRSQWPEAPPRSPSRRSRGGKDGGGKGRGFKGDVKGKSKRDAPAGASTGKSAGLLPDLPQLQAEAAWVPPIAPIAPPAAPPTPPSTAESSQMKTLMSALKKVSTELPPEIQAAMRGLQQDDSKQLTKQLHSAVSQLGNAKKSLAELSNARATLHQSWNGFLEAAITRWQRYAEEFAQQDKDLAAQIEKAKESVKSCKENFRDLQKLEGESKPDTAEVISDEEDQQTPSKVDVHMSQMQESLKALKGNMEEELRVSKRQRTDAVVAASLEESALCGQGGK